MEFREYERPREKVISSGVSTLSTVELLQLVIGPGGARATGAKLANKVEALLNSGLASFDELTKINGLGTAKACQILAAIELARRL